MKKILAIILSVLSLEAYAQDVKMLYQPNQPIGVAKGINPGRVAWSHAPGAATWDGTGNWYEDKYNDQSKTDWLVTQALTDLTGAKDARKAWNMLFRHFNKTVRGKKGGYVLGERSLYGCKFVDGKPGPEWQMSPFSGA